MLVADVYDRFVRVGEADGQARRWLIASRRIENRFLMPGDDECAFYYRIQSPVLLIEYDNHPGVFLANPEPARYHVHTIVHAPNGNDYGRDLLAQHYRLHHGGHGAG